MLQNYRACGCRLLGLALSRAATNRHVRVNVSEIGLLVSKGIHIHLAKVTSGAHNTHNPHHPPSGHLPLCFKSKNTLITS